MKAKVLKKYRDKNTKVIQNVGDIIEVTDERFEEINRDKTRLEAIPEEQAGEPESAKVQQEDDATVPSDEDVSEDELKRVAKRLKISGYTKMNKEELLAAIHSTEE